MADTPQDATITPQPLTELVDFTERGGEDAIAAGLTPEDFEGFTPSSKGGFNVEDVEKVAAARDAKRADADAAGVLEDGADATAEDVQLEATEGEDTPDIAPADTVEDDGALDAVADSTEDEDQDDAPALGEGSTYPSEARAAGEAANLVADEVLAEDERPENDRDVAVGDEIVFHTGAGPIEATVERVYNRNLVDLRVDPQNPRMRPFRGAVPFGDAAGTWGWPQDEE